MDSLLGALAEPWTRRWTGQIAGAALTFWVTGLVLYVWRHPAALDCRSGQHAGALWCRAVRAGGPGYLLVVGVAVGVVLGSAYIVAALTPQLIYVLAGSGWPIFGPGATLTRPLMRALIRRQARRRGQIAASGEALPTSPPAVPDGADRRRRGRRAQAEYAAAVRADSQVVARLRRYPAAAGALAPTRIGNVLAALGERVHSRHGLDLAVCWELLIAVLPPAARARLTAESSRAILQAQTMIWALAAAAWSPLLPASWAIAGWLIGLAGVTVLLYAGLCRALESYCDLVEAIVLATRHRLYQATGLPLPASVAAEPADGARLTEYVLGLPSASVDLAWPAPDTAAEAAAD
jgi:hypothetical protein